MRSLSIAVNSTDVQQVSLLLFEAVSCSEQPAGVDESGSAQRLIPFRLGSEPQGRLPGPLAPVGYTYVHKHKHKHAHKDTNTMDEMEKEKISL